MDLPIRVAVLECDEPTPDTKQKYGGFRGVFEDLLQKGLAKNDFPYAPRLEVLGYDVVGKQTYPDLRKIDAILLTGSRYDSYSCQDDWILRLLNFVQQALQDSAVRVMGVCFGHQVIGRALGVMPMRSDRGWEVSVTDVPLTDVGRQVFGQDSLAIHQMHRDVVPFAPSGVQLLGSTSRCRVQGMYVEGRLMSLQGHPEFDSAMVKCLLNRRRGIAIDEQTYIDGMSRADLPHDGVVIAAAFVRFLL